MSQYDQGQAANLVLCPVASARSVRTGFAVQNLLFAKSWTAWAGILSSRGRNRSSAQNLDSLQNPDIYPIFKIIPVRVHGMSLWDFQILTRDKL